MDVLEHTMNALEPDLIQILHVFVMGVAIVGATALIILVVNALWIFACVLDEFSERVINKLEVKVRRLRE